MATTDRGSPPPLLRAGFAVSEQQRRKVRDHACAVCWRTPVDPAHLIPRSMAPDPDGDPLRVIPLCRDCHRRYDERELDLLPHVARHFRRECAVAVQIVGLVPALNRITNSRWEAVG